MNLNEFLSGTELFMGISAQEIGQLSSCLTPQTKKYSKGQTIHSVGDIISTIGIVITGAVNIEIADAWGNNSIIDKIVSGGIFGESYASIDQQPLAVNVTAAESTQVVFFDITKLLCICCNICTFHAKLIQNLVQNLAKKNVNMSNKMRYITPKSIRARLIAYLSAQSYSQNNRSFDIPFNRQQLADYLSVDRSALSNELSKMRKDGLIDYYKNSFKLLKKDS